jgi:transcriptional regulator with XRE-family HTH domain
MRIEAELERTRGLLWSMVETSCFTQSEIAIRCGWSDSRLSRLIKGGSSIRIEDLLRVLAAIQISPGDFFYALYGKSTLGKSALFRHVSQPNDLPKPDRS